jgi:hypothetical protein
MIPDDLEGEVAFLASCQTRLRGSPEEWFQCRFPPLGFGERQVTKSILGASTREEDGKCKPYPVKDEPEGRWRQFA